MSALVFTMMSATLKTLTVRYPIGEIVFFRSAFALLPLLLWLRWQGDLINAVRTKNVVGHFKRGFIGTGGMYLGFAALSYLPLHDAIAIGYASPLIVVILAALLLKEKVRAYRWTAVGIGFVGVLIMLSPYLKIGTFGGGLNAGPTLGAMFAFAGAFCSAGAMIQVRRLTETEKTGAIVFYFFILASGLSLCTITLGWHMPDAMDLRPVRSRRHPGRNRADPADPVLPVRRYLGDRALRIHHHDLGAPVRLVRVRRPADRSPC